MPTKQEAADKRALQASAKPRRRRSSLVSGAKAAIAHKQAVDNKMLRFGPTECS
jgi:hypothetical protein